MTTTRAASADGTGLAVHTCGPSEGPVVVAVHGYPDDHTVWHGVAAALADTHHVITYDVRGAGASDVPTTRAGYRQERLTDDLVAVLDAAAPGRAVHLLGHDWGSIQAWPALTEPRLAGRITSYTSISGPSLAQAAVWMRGLRGNPRAVLRQLGRSYYTLLFQLPKLPEAAARAGLIDRAAPGRNRSDQIHGINLYRANMLAATSRARPSMIDVPVQVIAPVDDPFVTPQLQTEAPRPFVHDLRTHLVPGGHWIVTAQPQVVADHVRDLVVETS